MSNVLFKKHLNTKQFEFKKISKLLTKSMFNFVVAISVLLTTGCGGIYTKTLINDDSELTVGYPPSHEWLNENKESIVKKIVKHVRKSHPLTVDSFPRIELGVVDVSVPENTHEFWDKEQGAENVIHEFREIFSGVTNELLPPLPSSDVWLMDSEISFLYKKDLDELNAKNVVVESYYVVCFFSGLLVVCPTSTSEFVKVNVTITSPKNKKYNYQSLAGVRFSEIGVYKQQDGIPDLPIRALSAAIADITDQFVKEVNQQK